MQAEQAINGLRITLAVCKPRSIIYLRLQLEYDVPTGVKWLFLSGSAGQG